MPRIKQAPTPSGTPSSLASGQVVPVTFKFDTGVRARVIHLEFGSDGTNSPGMGVGTIAANGMLGEIRIVGNGNVLRRATAQQWNAINSTNGAQYAAKTSGSLTNSTIGAGTAGYRTRLSLFLEEPWRRFALANDKGVAIPEAEFSAWNLTGSLKTFTVEVDLVGRTSAGANAIVDTPIIKAFMEYDDLTDSDIGNIVKWKRINSSATATTMEIRDLDRNQGSYQSLHLFPTSGNNYVTSMLFTRNNIQERQDVDRYQNDLVLNQRGMNIPALDTTSATTKQNTGAYHLVFDYDDPVRNMLGVKDASELTMKPTFDSAPTGQMDIIAQITGPIA